MTLSRPDDPLEPLPSESGPAAEPAPDVAAPVPPQAPDLVAPAPLMASPVVESVRPLTVPTALPAPKARPLVPEDDEPEAEEDELPRENPVDPTLLLFVLMGFTVVGFRTLAPDIRNTIVWTAQLAIGIVAILLDQLEVEIPTGGDMLMGIGFGLILGLPALVLFSSGLGQISVKLFGVGAQAAVFQSVVLVMPAAETILFRGSIQPTRGLLFTALVATAWSVVLFSPQMQIAEFLPVAGVIAGFFLATNLIYGYLKLRFGVFASWTAQMTISVLLLFVSRFAL